MCVLATEHTVHASLKILLTLAGASISEHLVVHELFDNARNRSLNAPCAHTTAILTLECRHYLQKSTVDVGGLSYRSLTALERSEYSKTGMTMQYKRSSPCPPCGFSRSPGCSLMDVLPTPTWICCPASAHLPRLRLRSWSVRIFLRDGEEY